MAKYRVIEGFYDLQDPEGRAYRLYNKGDAYPREGLNPDPERIAFLLSGSNRLSRPVIEEDSEEPAGSPAADPEEAPVEEGPAAGEPPAGEAKPKRRRKKAQ